MTIRALTLLTALLAPCVALAAEWTDWRGPLENRSVAGDSSLVTSFDPEKGTNILWKNEESGGISTPVIMGGRIYTLVRHKPGTTEEADNDYFRDVVRGRNAVRTANHLMVIIDGKMARLEK